ncbi:MAG: family 20 glycosylhydrolase [Kiritimatiellia bacterium]
MKVNGLMIDCSRLVERHEYYHRLLDFMADWGMNTLVLHFSDDYGCAVTLPGFEELAMPHAFSRLEIRSLLDHAGKRRITIIPELETFGHTRFITDHPRYQHLFAGRKTGKLRFNALDPLKEETHSLMRRLIRATCTLFPGRFLHLGCDEVDFGEYCRRRSLDPSETWATYVNAMIGYVRELGRTPLIWADHLVHDEKIRRMVRKDVILVHWNYTADVTDEPLRRLKEAGFKRIWVAPSLACAGYRFLPTEIAIENTNRMVSFAAHHGLKGVLNTIWCPFRYLQNALYYGIAYSAQAVACGQPPKRADFHKRFVREVFCLPLSSPLEEFLEGWTGLVIRSTAARKIMKRSAPEWSEDELAEMRRMHDLGLRLLSGAQAVTPKANCDIWRGMVLAAQCAWLCTEWVILRRSKSASQQRKEVFNRTLRYVRRELGEEWDRTRYPDDPQKKRAKFPGTAHQYALLLMRRLTFV